MKSNNSILTEKEIQARTKFWNKKQFRTWNKKQFRTWSKKELERTRKNLYRYAKTFGSPKGIQYGRD